MFDVVAGDEPVGRSGLRSGAVVERVLSEDLLVEAAGLCEVLEEIAASEREINRLQAAQMRRVAQFASRRRDWDAAAYPGWVDEAERILAAEVAAARKVSVTSARFAAAEAQLRPDLLGRLDALVAAEIGQLLPGQGPVDGPHPGRRAGP